MSTTRGVGARRLSAVGSSVSSGGADAPAGDSGCSDARKAHRSVPRTLPVVIGGSAGPVPVVVVPGSTPPSSGAAPNTKLTGSLRPALRKVSEPSGCCAVSVAT